MIKQIMNAKNENNFEEEEEEQQEITPDMLKPRELEEFPEPGTIHNIQIGLEHGFFGNDASISGNRKGYEGSIACQKKNHGPGHYRNQRNRMVAGSDRTGREKRKDGQHHDDRGIVLQDFRQTQIRICHSQL